MTAAKHEGVTVSIDWTDSTLPLKFTEADPLVKKRQNVERLLSGLGQIAHDHATNEGALEVIEGYIEQALEDLKDGLADLEESDG